MLSVAVGAPVQCWLRILVALGADRVEEAFKQAVRVLASPIGGEFDLTPHILEADGTGGECKGIQAVCRCCK